VLPGKLSWGREKKIKFPTIVIFIIIIIKLKLRCTRPKPIVVDNKILVPK
jgi:hypothetical protein